MRSLRNNNLTIQSIRLEIFEKSNWISKRFAAGEDEEERERIFLPSRRYGQMKPPRGDGKGQRDRVVSDEIEKVIYRSVFMKNAYQRDKKKLHDYRKDVLEVRCSLRRSKTTLKAQKLDALCKHLSNRREVFIRNDIQTQGKSNNKRLLKNMLRPATIMERKYSTQPSEEIAIQKKSMLLVPITLEHDFQLGIPTKKKRKRAELLHRLNKHHQFSLKSKETQLSPWKAKDSLSETLYYPFPKK